MADAVGVLLAPGQHVSVILLSCRFGASRTSRRRIQMLMLRRWPVAILSVELAAIALVAGCAPDNVTGTTPTGTATTTIVGPRSSIVFPGPVVSAPGSNAGAFINLITPSNMGRNSGGAFWDNHSADDVGTATMCNIGFFAVGLTPSNCANQ